VGSDGTTESIEVISEQMNSTEFCASFASERLTTPGQSEILSNMQLRHKIKGMT